MNKLEYCLKYLLHGQLFQAIVFCFWMNGLPVKVPVNLLTAEPLPASSHSALSSAWAMLNTGASFMTSQNDLTPDKPNKTDSLTQCGLCSDFMEMINRVNTQG